MDGNDLCSLFNSLYPNPFALLLYLIYHVCKSVQSTRRKVRQTDLFNKFRDLIQSLNKVYVYWGSTHHIGIFFHGWKAENASSLVQA